MTAPEPTPTHHHGDGRRCSWWAPRGWWYEGGPCFRQDHPSGNAEAQ